MDKEKQFYSLSDFFNDDSFISWRLLQTEELNNYWEKFLKEHPDSEALLQSACEKFDSIKLNQIHLATDIEDELLENIYKRIKKHQKSRKQLIYLFSIASSFLLIIGVTIFLNHSKKIVSNNLKNEIVGTALPNEKIQLIIGNETIDLTSNSTVFVSEHGSASITDSVRKSNNIKLNKNLNKLIVPYGKRSFITLADGTDVWLNSGTEMTFPSDFSDCSRDIEVKGEVYIEVAKSKKPFYVNINQARIKVLGTKFNVTAYDDDSDELVVLVNGKVEVELENNIKTILTQNEMAIISNNTIQKEIVNAYEYISWHKGVLELKNATMVEILKKIGRYYNVSFENSSDVLLNDKTVSGKLFLSQNLDSVMTSISIMSSTQYKRENNNILIRRLK